MQVGSSDDEEIRFLTYAVIRQQVDSFGSNSFELRAI